MTIDQSRQKTTSFRQRGQQRTNEFLAAAYPSDGKDGVREVKEVSQGEDRRYA